MTIKATFEVRKPTQLLAKLNAKRSIKDEASSIMRGWGGRVQNRMQTYPGQVGTYRRTGRYGRGMHSDTKITASAIITKVDNAVSYAQYVGGDRQRGFHAAHGWQKVDTVAGEEWRETLDRLRDLFGG